MEKQRILLVDDAEVFIEVMTDALTEKGFSVTAARNGLEALELARAQHFDLVLLDLLLPRMTGFDVLKELRKQEESDRELRVLAVSGVFKKEAQLSYLRELGACGFISKDQTPAEIAARVEREFKTGDPVFAGDKEAAWSEFIKSPRDGALDFDRLPLFRDFSAPQRDKLLDTSRTVSFAAGEHIIKEGETGNAFYVIARGRVRVEKSLADGEVAVIAKLEAGDAFGELSLVDREVRSASCVAEDAVELIEITRVEFNRALADDPELELKALRALVKLLAERLRETDLSLTFSRALLDRSIAGKP